MQARLSRFLQQFKAPDAGPGSIAREFGPVERDYLYFLPVPFVFIALKGSGITLLSPAQAEHLLDLIAVFDPAVMQHLAILTKLNKTIDIANYPVFLIVCFVVLLIPIVHASCIAIKRWRVLMRPHPAGFVMIAAISALYYLFEIGGVNSASLVFRKPNQLYFDSAGFYYFYQSAVWWVYAFGLYIVALMIASSASVVLRYATRTPRQEAAGHDSRQ